MEMVVQQQVMAFCQVFTRVGRPRRDRAPNIFQLPFITVMEVDSMNAGKPKSTGRPSAKARRGEAAHKALRSVSVLAAFRENLVCLVEIASRRLYSTVGRNEQHLASLPVHADISEPNGGEYDGMGLA